MLDSACVHATVRRWQYFESRGGKFDEVCFFGLQYFIKRYLCGAVVTRRAIDEAKAILGMHMPPGNFNEEGWEYILKEHGGKLPVSIKAVPEGTVVPIKNVLFTMVNTDPKCYWLTNYLETLLVEVRREGSTLLEERSTRAPPDRVTDPCARGCWRRRRRRRCGTR